MASTNKGTTGGVVDLPMIIAQINAANKSLETIVDAVIDSTNVIVLAAKVEIAKIKLKRSGKILVDFVTSVSKEIETILGSLDSKQIQSNVSGLVANPEEFQKNMQAKPESAVKLLANKTSGVLEYIIGINAAINLIGDLKVPGGRRLKRKMRQVRLAFGALKSTLPDIITEIQTLNELLQGADPKSLKNILTSVSDMMSTLLHIMGYITLVTLVTPIFVLVAPIALIGVFALTFVIKGMVSALYMIGSPAFIQETNIMMRGVKHILRNILKCMMYIAATIAAMMLLVILTSMVGVQLLIVFPAFILGLMSLAILFGIMVVALKIINRMANIAGKQALRVLIHMLILSTILVILALVFMLLAQVSNMVSENILGILVLLGVMGLVLLAIMGFMALAALIAPALAVGLVAITLVMAAVMVLMVLTLAMAMLVLAASILNPDEVIDAVDKVLTTTEYVIQAILNKDFKRTEKKQDGGLIRKLMGSVFGDEALGIFDLIVKISILFLTVIAVGVMMLLSGLLVSFVLFYGKIQGQIKQAPGVVKIVMDACATIIRTVLDSETSTKIGESDDLFLKLVSFVSPDLASICQLLFKVAIIMLTIVVLMMVRVVMEELLWLQKAYEEHDDLYGEDGTAVTVVKNIMMTCSAVISLVLNAGAHEMTSGDSKFLALVSFVSPDLVTILQLLFKVAIIALTMVVLAMLEVIVEEMQWLVTSTNTFNFAALEDRVKTIINAADGVINALSTTTKEPNGKPRNGLQKLLKIIGLNKMAEVIGLLCAFARIGVAVAALSVLMSVVNIMKTCWETYNAMGGEKIGANAVTMTNGLLRGLDAIIVTLNDSKVKLEDVDDGLESLQATIPLFRTIMDITKLMKKAVNEIQSIKDANLQKIGVTCKKISEAFNKLLDSEDGLLPFIVEHSQAYGTVVKNTDKLINRVNGLNINKLDTLAKMFGNAAAFAQAINGNFDKLADVINEKMAPILEGLQKTIEDADRHIKEYTERQEQASQRTSAAFERLASTTSSAAAGGSESQNGAPGAAGGSSQKSAPSATGGAVPPGGANPTLQGAGQSRDVRAAAQADVTTQIESALRSFFRTSEGRILVSTT